MRVVLVCPYDWIAHGGVRAHVASLAAVLARSHDVRVVAPASQPLGGRDVDHLVVTVGKAMAVPFNRSVARVATSPAAGRRALAAIEDFDPDVVHVHEPGVPAVSLAVTSRCRRPMVGTFHAWSSRDLLYRSAGPVGKRIAQRLAARIAVSPAAQRYHSEALHLPLDAFRVVPNGVDVERFEAAEPLPELADPERPVLLFVGRLEERKGLDVLVRAFLRLRETRPGLRLVVVGDGPERHHCESLLPVGAKPDVLFVGAVTEEDKPRFHASADVYVAPNLGGESFGIVLLEAMAAGLPVVASDIPGFRNVVSDGREGRLVPPGDAKALAREVDRLLDAPRLAAAMAAQGRITAQAFAWHRVAERVAEAYGDVLARA